MPPSSVPAPGSLPFLEHLRRESARFRAVLTDAPAGARVPTCPDWDTDDLIWHLAEVQWFWGAIAEGGLTRHEQVRALDDIRPTRAGDRSGLLTFYDSSSERLQRALSGLPAQTELWMWAPEHTAGYIQRRQAHEALIHRIDAELTAGSERHPIDCRLAADGIDEALRLMRGYEDEPGLTATAMAGSVTIAAVNGMHAWTVTPVFVTGTDRDGDNWDVPRFRVDDGPDTGSAAEINGTAADLDCWLWNRPTVDPVDRQGDPAALAAVDAVLAGDID